MESEKIREILKEELQSAIVKNNITEEVPYDDCMGDDGKISIWKSVKSYWKPKNWFNYKDYVSREKFWKTFLGNILLGLGLSPIIIVAIIAFGKISPILPIIGGLALIPFLIINFVATISLLARRANCAGINKNFVWYGYVLLTLLPYMGGLFVLLGAPAILSAVFKLLSWGSIVSYVWIGVSPNKYLEYKKVAGFPKNKTPTDGQVEVDEGFFTTKN